MNCVFCKAIKTIPLKSDPFLVYEFPNSILKVGQHQMIQGYCVLILKQHETELHALSPSLQIAFYQELMQAGKAIFQAFGAHKINYASYGNIVPHLHWHIIPRFILDRAWPNPLWTEMQNFDKYPTELEQATRVAQQIQQYLF